MIRKMQGGNPPHANEGAMFEVKTRQTKAGTALQMAELIFFWTMREIAGKDKNPLFKLLGEIAQSALMILAFYALFSAFGMRRSPPIRGDMIMFLASGIFLFMAHNKTISAVFVAEGPDNPLMQHAPMNTFVAIAAQALSALYLQLMSIIAMLCAYELYSGNVAIADPAGALQMFLLAWWFGVCIGLFFRAIKLFFPKPAAILRTTYQRLNMIFSGKMMPANALPLAMLPMFSWNPLFHVIDASRGAVFLNYNSYRADLGYAVSVVTVLLILGLLGDFYARQLQRRAATH